MGTDIGKGGICGQIFLVIVNCVFIVLGIAAVAIGGWIVASERSIPVLTTTQVIGGGAILIVAGGVTIIIASIGILGAICKSRILLMIYALVVLLIVILEIIAGILGFVFRVQVLQAVDNTKFAQMFITEYNYTVPNDANVVVDTFQTAFSCCGGMNASDWLTYNLKVVLLNDDKPPSCPICNATVDDNCAPYTFNVTVGGVPGMRTFYTTTVGCTDSTALSLASSIVVGGIAAGVFGIVVGLLEIIGIIFALLLCCCIHRSLRQEVV